MRLFNSATVSRRRRAAKLDRLRPNDTPDFQAVNANARSRFSGEPVYFIGNPHRLGRRLSEIVGLASSTSLEISQGQRLEAGGFIHPVQP
jgi:hypothetical protein